MLHSLHGLRAVDGLCSGLLRCSRDVTIGIAMECGNLHFIYVGQRLQLGLYGLARPGTGTTVLLVVLVGLTGVGEERDGGVNTLKLFYDTHTDLRS